MNKTSNEEIGMTDDEIEEAICAFASSGLREAAESGRVNLSALNIDPADL
jgi:hypothetical protein